LQDQTVGSVRMVLSPDPPGKGMVSWHPSRPEKAMSRPPPVSERLVTALCPEDAWGTFLNSQHDDCVTIHSWCHDSHDTGVMKVPRVPPSLCPAPYALVFEVIVCHLESVPAGFIRTFGNSLE
jgi:hypothetical protein